MRLTQLDNVVLKMSHFEDFFDGVSSNETDKPWNAFLEKFGKIISTFAQVVDHDTIYITFPSKVFLTVKHHLEPYVKLQKHPITLTAYRTYLNLDDDFDQTNLVIDLNPGQIIISPADLDPELVTVSEEAFLNFRLDNNLPFQLLDFDHEMVLNVHESRYTSLTKGCYVGQEIVAKVMNKATPPMKLVPDRENGKFKFVKS